MKWLLPISILTFIMMVDVKGQGVTQEKLLQVDGIVYDAQRNPLANISIYSMALRKGVISKPAGIYSIISIPGDTIVFSSVGLKKTFLITPSDIIGNRFMKDVIMEYDTIALNDVLVLPWGSYAEFKRAVIEADIHNQEIENMNANLILIQKQIMSSANVSPEAAYTHLIQQMYNASYSRNQMPQNNLLNPFAWAKFFESLKKGLLKNENKR